jgi:ATP-binding cassette subfamily C protein LapB
MMFRKKPNVDSGIQNETEDLLHATLSYLRYLGADVDKAALLSGLPIVSEELPVEYLSRATDKLGYSSNWTRDRRLQNVVFPCCVALKDGRFLVIVGILDGEFQVLSKGSQNAVHRVPFKELKRLYKGRYFRLRPKVELLQEKHDVPVATGHWFWSRIFFRRIRILDIVLASFFANLIAVAVSLFALQVYDRVIPGQSEATLWVLVGGAAIAILFEAAIRVSRSKLIDQTGKEAELKITQELFAKLLGMRMESRPAQPGALVHMIREFAAVREFFTTASVGVVADLPFVVIFLALIYGIAGPIVWIIVTGAVLTILPSLIFQARMARLSKETLGGMSSASRLLTEAAYNLENVKLAQASPRFQRSWEEITVLNTIKTTEQRELSAFLTFWATAMQQCTYVAAVVGGVYMVFAGEFTVGSIIAVSILSTRTLSPITQLSGVVSRWQNMKTSLDALEGIIGSTQERGSDKTYLRRVQMNGEIELKNVKFTHAGSEVPSLQVGALNLQPGTNLAVLGENGSGKSTLLRVLSGLYYPTEGEMVVDKLDIRQIDPLDIRNNIGLLPQELSLSRGTIRENLGIASHDFVDDELLEALEFAGLGDFVRQHARGLDLEIVDGGDGLSVGQRQSLGLARLYLQNPSIVLLDEPTAALDQNLEQKVVARLGEWLKDKTCVIATHRMPILSIVDRIAVMKGGQLVMEGTRDEVLKRLTASPASQEKLNNE